jgi:hypothetical protein
MRVPWLPILASFACAGLAAAALLAGCDSPAYYVAPPDTKWSTPDEPPLDLEKLMPKSDFEKVKATFREAYDKQAKPNLVFIVNRQFQVEDERAVEPKAAVGLKAKVEERPANPEEKGGTVAEGSARITLFERRPEQARDPARIHQLAYELIESELAKPFRDLNCQIVEADLAAGGVPDPLLPINLAKLGERADILLFVRTECARVHEFGQTLHRVRFAAKALDLRNSRSLAHVLRTAESLELETSAGADYFKLTREDLVRGTRRLACALMQQVVAAWEQGSVYTLTIRNLASETQLAHVTNHLKKQTTTRRLDVLKANFGVQGGEAVVRVEFAGMPDRLVQVLRDPQAFTGFRIELTLRHYTDFLASIVPT